MNDDAFIRAARALRETFDGTSPHAAATKASLLLRARQRRKRQRTAAVVLLPIAAVFVMSSAWAAVTGRLPGVSALWRSLLAPTTPAVAPGRHGTDRSTEPEIAAPSASAPPDVSATQDVTPAAPGTPATIDDPTVHAVGALSAAARAGSAAPRASSVAQGTTRTRSAPDAATDAEESLYTEAHLAHFVARDPQAALRGWDAYLAAYPNGRFALEARYNRALTLVRLGRTAEARAALAPFASGSTGGYRQREARALLDLVDGGE